LNRNADKTHCPYGHPYTEANTYLTKANQRQCRVCRTERQRLSAEERVLRRRDRQKLRTAADLAQKREALTARIAEHHHKIAALVARLAALTPDAQPPEPTTPTLCPKGHPIPPDRKKCPECARGWAIHRFYAKKGS